MRPLVMGGVGPPASGFEGGCVYEAIVDSEKTLSHSVGDFIEVACAKLIGNESGEDVSIPVWRGYR